MNAEGDDTPHCGSHHLQSQLAAIAASVRALPDAADVHHAAIPGMPAARMEVYRGLIRNNLRALLASNFPVLRQIHADADWNRLVDAFVLEHRAHTPLFTEVGSEFVDYLQQRQQQHLDPPWFAELAHYEWVELALQISDATAAAHDPQGDLLTGCPLLAPTAWPLAYRWPVHQIGPDNLPQSPPSQPTLLLARRERDGDVRFATLSVAAYALLEGCTQHPATSGGQLLQTLAALADNSEADAESFIVQGEQMLRAWHAQGIVLGTRINDTGAATERPATVT